MMVKKVCSVVGCEGKYEARGYCAKHYTRMRNSGSVGLMSETLGEIPHGARTIPGHESYCATPDGQIFSRNFHLSGKTKALSQFTHVEGYKKVKTAFSTSPVPVHRLVAMAFLPNPENLEQVNHKDGNKGNNQLENLEWCDNAWNQKHAYLTGLHVYATGEKHVNSKLTEKEVLEIRAELKATPPYKGQLTDIGKKYGVSNFCIFDIKKGKSWRHLK